MAIQRISSIFHVGIQLSVLVALHLAMVGCGSSKSAIPMLTSSPSTDPSAISPSTSNLFIVTATYKNTLSTAVLHEQSSWSKECSFSSTDSTATKNMSCTLDINELDLYSNSVTFNWSVPPGMCTYVHVHPYYFFQYPPYHVAGATTATLASLMMPAVTYTETITDGHVTAFAQTSPNPAIDPIVSVDPSGTLKCKYDYTGPDGGPNCCDAKYTGTVTTISGLNTIVSTNTGYFSGKVGNCTAGPATQTTAFGKDKYYNMPFFGHYYTVAGRSDKFVVDNPMDSAYSSNLWAANSYTTASLYPFPIFQPYYWFLCLDPAEEVLGYAKITIREWNMGSELAKGAAGNPDTTGTETDHPGTPASQLNDRYDWEDFGTYPRLGL